MNVIYQLFELYKMAFLDFFRISYFKVLKENSSHRSNKKLQTMNFDTKLTKIAWKSHDRKTRLV